MDYAIFKNKKTEESLVYYPVAKNANSSVKLFLLKHLNLQNDYFFIEDQLPRYTHKNYHYKNQNGKQNLINFLPPYTPFKRIKADYKYCLVRDPINRFISAYKNRILYHKDKGFFEHSVDMIIDKLDNNKFENRHFLPQTYWLGNDIKYFTQVSKLPNINSFIDVVNSFFGRKIIFPHIQIGGKDFEIKLTRVQKKKIEKIYSHDYELMKNIF